ncbi:hypothetical protein M0R04_13075 [Candidatus Dojkabacteria bacterium]|jgi:hypothetical protein|nr:hypothetical protein [Candidatus Dojkabacteria bacterium]
MDSREITAKVKQEIDYCEQAQIKMNPAFAKTQGNIIDLIEKYWLSQYRDGDFDSFGNPRPFYNISTFPVDIASKLIESDVKDIKVISEDQDYWTAFVMQKELHQWMKDRYFGNFLNKLAYDLPKYGHTVVKKVGDTIEIVPLSNLRFRPDAVSMKGIPMVERHKYQPDEFIVEAKKNGWENWNEVDLRKYETQEDSKLAVYEAWFPKGFLEGTDDNYFIVSADGVVLAHMQMAKSLYKDISWEKVRGRTMGRGQVEKLFHEQIYLNRIASDKSDGLAWTSKHLFQTRDNSIARNLLSQVENGDVLITNDPVEPIANEERNLSFYNQDEYKWESNAMRKTFTGEQPQSKSVPANAKAAMVNYQIQSGYFKTKREELNNFIKEIIVDWILPDFKNSTRKEHQVIIRNIMSGDAGSDKLFQMVVSQRLNEKKFESLLNGKLIMPDEENVMKSVIADGVKNEKIEIPKGIYEDVMTKIDIVIGNESMDMAEQMQNLTLLSNMANNNPGSFTPTELKAIKRKLMEAAGFNPHELGGDDPIPSIQDQMAQQRMAQPGGSIAKPNVAQMPVMNNQPATV